MKERIGEREVHIFLRRRKSRGHENRECDGRLQSPSSLVVSHARKQPKKQHWQHQMIERKEPNPQRLAGVEKIFRSSDQVMADEKPPARVEGPGYAHE